MQLLDELSMIYTTCIIFYAIFSHGRSTLSSILLLLFTIVLAIFITAYYHYLQNPVFHQNMFALLTAIVVFRSIYAMETTFRSSLKPKRRPDGSLVLASVLEEEARMDARDMVILRTMWKMIACGLSAVAGGFLIWNLDNEFCSTLRSWRREIGLPWGLFLEGHGWW
jgi:dihydroceramidase